MKTVGKTASGVGLAIFLALCGAFIVPWEGSVNAPYPDIGGVLTVCHGHTGNVQQRKYSDAECRDLLSVDMLKADAEVARCIPGAIPLTVEASLVSLVYNVGSQAVCGSTIQRRALAHDWHGVCEGIPAWNKAGGKVVQGLVKRRADERALCLSGLIR